MIPKSGRRFSEKIMLQELLYHALVVDLEQIRVGFLVLVEIEDEETRFGRRNRVVDDRQQIVPADESALCAAFRRVESKMERFLVKAEIFAQI